MARVILLLVGAFDLLVLAASALAWMPYATSDAGRALAVAFTWGGLIAQVGIVSLALRWRQHAAPQVGNVRRRHAGALALLIGVAVFDAFGLAAALFAVSFPEYRAMGIGSCAYVLANVGTLVAAWRWRPWALAAATASALGSAT